MLQGLGVIGGGQLAWMMADAALSMGIPLFVQTPSIDDPAAKIANDVILAEVNDVQATLELAKLAKVITFENEFVDLDSLETLENNGVCFRPSISSLKPLLDKLHQREFLRLQGIPIPQFQPFIDKDSITFYPIVLKTRRGGYDGVGTFVIGNFRQLDRALNKLKDIPLLIEQYIPFTKELAVIAARSVTGEIAIYPVAETFQENQVCHLVVVPAQVDNKIICQIQEIAKKLLESLHYVGVMGIEFFLAADGLVLVNEIAPRTHNSGHFSLDACNCSQFEMQVRAVLGLSLGSSELKLGSALMVNLLGYETAFSDYSEKRLELAKITNAHVHWYSKQQSRPGRKLGHVTVYPVDIQNHLSVVKQIESIWQSS